MIGALFFVVDGLQAITSGALRGFNDTFVPFLFSATGFWLVGFCGAYLLAFNAELGARRHLDRAVERHYRLCRPSGLALRGADPPRLPARQGRIANPMTEQLAITRLGHRGDGIADGA